MRWELLRYPAGDARAQMYWRRRMSVLGAVLAVGLLLVVLVARGGGSQASTITPVAAEPSAGSAAANQPPPADPPSAPADGPATSASPAPTPSPSATARPADTATTCASGTVALRVAADAGAYPAGQKPVLTLTVLSDGKPVWSSGACEPKRTRSVKLNPASAQMLQMSWDRTRNASGCTSGAMSALPAGQYELVAHVGTLSAYGGDLTLK
jgi:hypothetical protein